MLLLFGGTKPFKTRSCLPLSELVLEVNSTEAENQTGKSKYSLQLKPNISTRRLILTPQPVTVFFFWFFFPYAAPCEDEDCKKQQICEHTSSGISNCTCAAGFYGDKCEGIVRLAPADCSLQAAGQVESRLGYLKRSCAIPQEFGALPWKRLL